MIVITGGAGFIGSNLVAALQARGEHRLVVCDESDAAPRNIAKRQLHATVEPGALADFLADNRPDIRAVFHMGATSSTMVTDASLFARNNYRFSLRLWDWCAAAGVPFIYASSAATYGDGTTGFDDDASTAALARLEPLNPYGRSKLLFDRRVAHILNTNKPAPPQWAGLKFFNVYGPNEYHKSNQRSVVARIFPDAARGGPVRLFKSYHPDYADGGQLRDFVWVGDCVAVMLWLFDNPHASGLFNVGAGKARSFDDLAKAVYTALGLPANIEYIDMPLELRSRYQYFTEARMERLRTAGYDRPATNLEDGVREYVTSYLSQDDPYR